PGTLTLAGLVEGMDGPTKAALSAELTPLELAVESPPLLAVDATHAPLAADVGQVTEVTVTVANEGEAAARLVSVQLDALLGSAAFDRVSGPAPVVATLRAGESQTFRFTVRP